MNFPRQTVCHFDLSFQIHHRLLQKSFSVTVGGESGNSNQNGKQFGEGNSSNPLSDEQIVASGNEGEFEESNNSFIFNGNQSISVLA